MHTKRHFLTLGLLLSLLCVACTHVEHRVVVLPFENLKPNPKETWLRDGFSESLTDHLNNIENMKLVNREKLNAACESLKTSPYVPFADEKQAILIGEKAGAEEVVIGSFQLQNENLTVFSRVIRVPRGEVIHSYRVKATTTDNYRFFKQIQDLTINHLKALGIAEKDPSLMIKKLRSASERTRSFKAFEYYINGRLAFLKGDENELRVAATWFREAIKNDYLYGLAYVGLANTATQLGYLRKQTSLDYQEYYRQAHENIHLAKRYDPTLGIFHYSHTQDLLNADISFIVGETHLRNKQYQEALAAYRKSLSLNSDDGMTIFRMGEAYLGLGEIDRARSHYSSALEKNPSLTSAMDRLEEIMVRHDKSTEKNPAPGP